MNDSPDIADGFVLLILICFGFMFILTVACIIKLVQCWRKKKIQRLLWLRWRINKIRIRNNFYKSLGK